MILGNPSLPIAFDLSKAKQLVTDELKKRNWKEVSIESAKLALTPYYFFEFQTFDENLRNGEKIVKNVKQGSSLFDPEKREIVDSFFEEMPDESQMLKEINQEFEIKKTGLEPDSAEKLYRLKLAEKLEKPIERIGIISSKQFYLPVWKIKAKMGKEEISLNLNAFDGSSMGKEIPQREKTNKEIAKETLHELKSPKTWLQYTADILRIIAKKIWGKKGNLQIGKIKISKAWTITTILVIILIIVAFFL